MKTPFLDMPKYPNANLGFGRIFSLQVVHHIKVPLKHWLSQALVAHYTRWLPNYAMLAVCLVFLWPGDGHGRVLGAKMHRRMYVSDLLVTTGIIGSHVRMIFAASILKFWRSEPMYPRLRRSLSRSQSLCPCLRYDSLGRFPRAVFQFCHVTDLRLVHCDFDGGFTIAFPRTDRKLFPPGVDGVYSETSRGPPEELRWRCPGDACTHL